MEWLKEILDLSGKGIKESSKVLMGISFIALFISPSFIFLYLYDKSIFKESNLFIGIIMMIVISAILYIILFCLDSIILPSIYMLCKRDTQVISKSEADKMNNITSAITLILMGIIALAQIVTYYSNNNVTNDSSIKVGIITLTLIVGILLIAWVVIIVYNIYCFVVRFFSR